LFVDCVTYKQAIATAAYPKCFTNCYHWYKCKL